MRDRKLTLLVGSVVPALALFAAITVGSGEEDAGPPLRLIGRGTSVGLTNPISGELLSLAEAQDRAPFSLPVLPGVEIPNPCTGKAEQLQLLEVWASAEGTTPQDRQVGMVYSGGVWVMVESVGRWSETIQKAGELPSVDALDEPGRLIDARVRGHNAWTVEAKPTPCEEVNRASPPQVVGPSPNPGVSPTVDPSDTKPAVLYDPARTGSIRWVENGLVIEIVGPLSVKELTDLAEGLSWAE